MSQPTHLAVGLLKKPHGVKGDALVYPLTDAPELVFTAGRVLVLLDRDGRPVGSEVVVVRARAYQRAWLVHFRGMENREALEALRERYLGISAGEARPLKEGEFYLHELIGLAVELKDKTPVGVVRDVYDAPQGYLLGVRNEAGKEHLVPFTPGIVRRVDRAERRVVITPPDGLLEL
ncbi:MAG: ribosome maturation factor RimM [Gemmatimonadales bacterium]